MTDHGQRFWRLAKNVAAYTGAKIDMREGWLGAQNRILISLLEQRTREQQARAALLRLLYRDDGLGGARVCADCAHVEGEPHAYRCESAIVLGLPRVDG